MSHRADRHLPTLGAIATKPQSANNGPGSRTGANSRPRLTCGLCVHSSAVFLGDTALSAGHMTRHMVVFPPKEPCRLFDDLNNVKVEIVNN